MFCQEKRGDHQAIIANKNQVPGYYAFANALHIYYLY